MHVDQSASGLDGEHAGQAPGAGERAGDLHRARLLPDARRRERLVRRLGLAPALVGAAPPAPHAEAGHVDARHGVAAAARQRDGVPASPEVHTAPGTTVRRATPEGSPPASSKRSSVLGSPAARKERGTW